MKISNLRPVLRSSLYIVAALLILGSKSIVMASNPNVPDSPGWIPTSPTPKPGAPMGQSSPFSSGLWGANRMVTTSSGYGSLTGTFSDPNFFIGGLDPTALPVDTVYGQNPHRNKPTFFLALQGSGVALEGGLQWEQFAVVRGDTVEPRGWATFMRVESPTVWRFAWLWSETRINALAGQLGNTTLTLKVLDSYPDIETGASPTTDAPMYLIVNSTDKGDFYEGPYQPFWMRTGNSKSLTGNITGLNQWVMFRTIGITQSGDVPDPKHRNLSGCIYDGSYMRNVTFSGGAAGKVWQDANGVHTYAPNPQDPWHFARTINIYAKNKTEANPIWYRPDATDHRNLDPGHPWPIDFGYPYTLKPNPKVDQDRNNPNLWSDKFQAPRMTSEVVHINLLPGPTHTHTGGTKITPAKSHR